MKLDLKILLFSVYSLFFCSIQKAYSQNDTLILLVHSRYDTGKIRSEALEAYYINRGEVVLVDTIIQKRSDPLGKVDSRISIGLNDKLIKNRFLYTTVGLLIDLKEKKILLKDPGDFVKESNDTIFFTPSGSWDNFVLNAYCIKTHKIFRVLKRPFENNIRLISPDYNHALSFNYENADNRKIYLISKKAKKQLIVKDAGKQPLLYGGTHAFGDIPSQWVSPNQFLYLKYKEVNQKGAVWKSPEKNKEDSSVFAFSKIVADTLPCCSGEFHLYDIVTNKDEIVASTDSLFAPAVEDRFYQYNGKIFFRNNGFTFRNNWEISLSGNKAELIPVQSNKLFQIKVDTSYHPKGFDHRNLFVSFKGKSIGNFYGQDFEDLGSTFVAFGKQTENGKKFLLVWRADTNQWQKKEIPGFLDFIDFFKLAW